MRLPLKTRLYYGLGRHLPFLKIQPPQVDRKAVLTALMAYLKANNLKADWEGIENAPNEALVNALAMMSPYDPAEKQAMLEAPNLKTRAEILIAVTEIALAKSRTEGEPPLQ